MQACVYFVIADAVDYKNEYTNATTRGSSLTSLRAVDAHMHQLTESPQILMANGL